MGRFTNAVDTKLNQVQQHIARLAANAAHLPTSHSMDTVTGADFADVLAELNVVQGAFQQVSAHTGQRRDLRPVIAQWRSLANKARHLYGQEMADALRGILKAIYPVLQEWRQVREAVVYRSVRKAADGLYSADHLKDITPAQRGLWEKVFNVACRMCEPPVAKRIADGAVLKRVKAPVPDGRFTPNNIPKGQRGTWAAVYNAAKRHLKDAAKAEHVAYAVTGKRIKSATKPLVQGSSDEAVGENISRLRKEGKKPDQAEAIALNVARRARKSMQVKATVGDLAAQARAIMQQYMDGKSGSNGWWANLVNLRDEYGDQPRANRQLLNKMNEAISMYNQLRTLTDPEMGTGAWDNPRANHLDLAIEKTLRSIVATLRLEAQRLR